MKKKSLMVLAILLLCVSFAFAAGGMKTFKFGPQEYMVSELAPDISYFKFTLAGSIEVTPDPNPCSIFLFEGVNQDQTVLVRILVVEEGKQIYLAGIITMYISKDKDPYGDCYEDLQYFGGDKPSFVLTKVKSPGDVEKFIQMKKMQFGKKVAI